MTTIRIGMAALAVTGLVTASAGAAHAETTSSSNHHPTYDAKALAALKANNPQAATADLKLAMASNYEPAAAKKYARRAYQLIGEGQGLEAGAPATKGAGVEYLTYSLKALNNTQPRLAATWLMRAEKLPPSHHAAKRALGAIQQHDVPQAVIDIKAGLRKLHP